MNKYEICFKAWNGLQGKQNKPYYCDRGYCYDSKTDKKHDTDKCEDWHTRCSKLMHRKPKEIDRTAGKVILWKP